MDTQSRFMQFDPPPLLRSPHMQTLLSSRLVRGFSSAGQALLERAPLRLYHVTVRLADDQVVEDPPELVAELDREQLTAARTR